MSRTHERAYRLLAERTRLRPSARRALYGVVALLIGSGAWWLVVHYEGRWFPQWQDDLARLALENWAMKVHGAAAFVTLIAVGAMLTNHVRRGWELSRNRSSGALVLGTFAALTLTGYALYYLVTDDTRPPLSLAHWVVGLWLAPLFVVHIMLGRRTRRHPS